MSSPRSSIQIVTVTKDNPQELRETLLSVRLQSTLPHQHVIVDGSDEMNALEVHRLALKYSCKYLWRKPAGIYDAMKFGLSQLENDKYCIFLNSGDRFFSAGAITELTKSLENSEFLVHWTVGGIALNKPGAESVFYFPQSNEKVLWKEISAGRAWLPHPSSVFRTESLRDVKAYTEPLRIARDFSTSMRFWKKFGPPIVIPEVIAVFDTTGVSSSSSAIVRFENFLVRLMFFGPRALIVEGKALVSLVLRNLRRTN